MASDAAELFLRHEQAGTDPAFALIASMPPLDVTANGFDYGEEIIRLTAKKRMRKTLAAIRDALYRKRNEPVPAVGTWLKRFMNGCFEYHAVPTNLMRLEGFRSEVCRAWRHALLRRSQRHRLCWERFNRLTRKYVPPCRVRHPYPEERFFASQP